MFLLTNFPCITDSQEVDGSSTSSTHRIAAFTQLSLISYILKIFQN